MAKQLKKGKLLLLGIILLLVFSYFYKEEIYSITEYVSNAIYKPNPVIATQNDIELYDNALLTNDELLCSQIEFKDFKYDCLVKVAAVKKDANICETISEDMTRFGCITEVSKITNNAELCTKVESDSYWNSVCYKNYAIANNNSDYCWSIPEGTKNNPCFYEIAINTLDYKACGDIKDQSLFRRCNNQISQKALIVEPCLQMDIIDRDACILRLAAKKEEVKLCDEIKLNTIKQDCLDKFS